MPREIRPQIVAGNHILIGAKSATEPVIFLLQIRCAELTTDGLILCQFCLDCREFRYQQFDFHLQIGNGFLGILQELFWQVPNLGTCHIVRNDSDDSDGGFCGIIFTVATVALGLIQFCAIDIVGQRNPASGMFGFVLIFHTVVLCKPAAFDIQILGQGICCHASIDHFCKL